MNYVNRLRGLREDNDLKQKEIGKILNKSQQGYAHLENGVSRFTVEDIITLCRYYKISPEYVLGFTDEKKPLPKK